MSTHRLPLLKVIWGTFALTWMNRADWFRANHIPLLALIAVTLLWNASGATYDTVNEVLMHLAYMLATSWLAVRCHRLVLMGANAAIPETRAQELRSVATYLATFAGGWLVWVILALLLTSLAVFFLLGGMKSLEAGSAPAQPAPYDPDIQTMIDRLTMIATLPGSYLAARLSPLLPAIALGRPWSLRAAWEMSRGNGWRLVIVVVLLPYTFMWLVGLLGRDGSSAMGIAALAVLMSVVTSLEIIALSLAFREMEAPEPPPNYSPG